MASERTACSTKEIISDHSVDKKLNISYLKIKTDAASWRSFKSYLSIGSKDKVHDEVKAGHRTWTQTEHSLIND